MIRRTLRGRRAASGSALVLLAACAGAGATPSSPARPLQQRAATPTSSSAVLHAITLNIWHDQEDWPARLEYMLETLQALQPDIIALQEVLQNPTLPNQAQTIAERLGYSWYFASVDTPGSAKRYGNAILTRHPVLAQGFRRLEPLDDYRTVAHLRIRLGADSVDVYGTHLHHAAEGGGAVRQRQLFDLLDFVAETRARGPALLLGDFNAPATDPEIRTLAGEFSDTYGLLHGSADVSTLNPAKGHRPVRIDHIFYRHGATRALRPVGAELILDRPSASGLWASDHFGLHAWFEVPGW